MPKVGMEPIRRAEVINATLTCISRHGIDGMTLEKVADYADCSKGVVSYYFRNKDNLTVEAFKAFLAYYGQMIQADIEPTMTAQQMIDVTLKHILPPYPEAQEAKINVSQVDGTGPMHIPHIDQARLFVQFFSRAALDPKLQEVAAKSYQADLRGIAKIFAYASKSGAGQLAEEDAQGAAYGLMAMVVGLSFFRVAGIAPPQGEDNRYIGEQYVQRLFQAHAK